MNTLRAMFSNKSDKILLAIFIFMAAWVAVLNIFSIRETFYNALVNIFLVFSSGFGFVIGLQRMKQWGGLRSKFGKAILLISLGLLAFSIGCLAWTYYNLAYQIELPYPSFADLAYAQIYLYWVPGLIILANLTSIASSPKDTKEKVYFFCIPMIMALVTYYFIFVQLHGGNFLGVNNPLKSFLDLYYPGGDIVALTVVVLFSGLQFNYLGERLRVPITLIMVGLIINYISDFYFSYVSTVGAYYLGSMSDFLYACSMFLISLGLSNLHPKLLEDKLIPHS